ncbi:hypothetical protein ACHAO9_007451 [Fusarium lateritium]
MPLQLPETPLDTTFRNYSEQQAFDYAKGRLGYSKTLIDFILNYHHSTGGQNGTLLDIGCGPGTATHILAPHFDVAYGVDPGESMITTATDLGGQTHAGNPIIYKLSTAENIDKIESIPQSSVDMITAATAVRNSPPHDSRIDFDSSQAHWFDMPRFWSAAARVLKPGGTVAIWTTFRKPVVSNGESKLQLVFEEFRESLSPYTSAGTRLTQDGYVDLVMPWDNSATAQFYDRQNSARHELSAADGFFPGSAMEKPSNGSLQTQLQRFERLVSTFGTVDRWRKANPELVGTKEDCINMLVEKVRKVADESGGQIDMSVLAGEMAVALIFVKGQ